MKNSDKIQSSGDSYSVSEAATLLGVSIPTLKRMVADGTLDGFRTPGGHHRITAESIDAMKSQRRTRARPVREASPVLQNRRERLEELTLAAQEHRAKRELANLQREDQEEADKLEAEAQAREEEAAQRQAEIELERERLGHEKAQERRRLERERAQEEARFEAEQESTAFRQRWYNAAAQTVATGQLAWLTPGQRKEVTEALEAEIERRQPSDEPRMAVVITRSLEALVEPLRAERDAQERRQKLTEQVLRSLPYDVTEPEKVKAAVAIREALRRFEAFADVYEVRAAAQDAVEPVRRAVERRRLDARLLAWALRELPWSRTDRDEARIRWECAEVLAELPLDVSEPEGKEALEPTVNEVRREIEQRQAEKDRHAKKTRLVEQGEAEVTSYMLELERKGEIASEDYWDSDLRAELKDAVRCGLEADLAGDESAAGVRQMAREIIDSELG